MSKRSKELRRRNMELTLPTLIDLFMTPLKKGHSATETRSTQRKNQGGTRNCSAGNAKSIDSLRDTLRPPCPLCLCGKSGSFFGRGTDYIMRQDSEPKLTREVCRGMRSDEDSRLSPADNPDLGQSAASQG